MKRPTMNAATVANVTIELFTKDQRTVSYQDILRVLDRDYDTVAIDRIVELLPAAQPLIEEAGFPCTLVNSYCIRNAAEIPVQDAATAQRCTAMRSGGKPPVGLRHARPDDLVRGEVPATQVHLHIGGINHAAQMNANDVASGVASPDTRQRLQHQLQDSLTKVLTLEAEPRQAQLPE